MQKFGFLKNYISREKGRQIGGLAEKIAALRPLSGDESADEEAPEEVAASLPSTSEPVSRHLSTTSVTSSTNNSARKSMESTLRDHEIQSDRLAEHVADLISEHDVSKDSKTQFGLFFTSMIPKIDDSLLTSYMDGAYGLLMRYVHRTKQMCQQQFQQSYQSHQQYQQQQFPLQQYPQQHIPAPQYQQPQQFTEHHYLQPPWLRLMTLSIVHLRLAPVSTMPVISSRTLVMVTASCPEPLPSTSSRGAPTSTAASTSSVIFPDSMPTLE